MYLWSAVLSAAVAFFAASIDEFLILVACFSRSDLSAADVIVGSLLGFAAVLSASLVGIGAGFIVPTRYVKLLGLVPIFVGVRTLVRRYFKRRARERAAAAALSDDRRQDAPLILEGSAQIDGVRSSDEEGAGGEGVVVHETRRGACDRLFHSGVFEVFAITLGGGSEEIAVYLPLFASEAASMANVAAMILALAVLQIAWLGLARGLVKSLPLAKAIENFGEMIEPWVFIGIGVYCLLGSVIIPIPV